MIDAALALYDQGFNPIRLRPNGKEPDGVWKHQQEARLPRERLFMLFEGPCNLGIVMGRSVENLLGIDRDTKTPLSEMIPGVPESPMVVETAKGFHEYYRVPFGEHSPTAVRVGGLPIDLRGQGSFLVAPPSVVNGHTYRWIRGPVAAGELPFFPLELLPKDEVIHTEVRQASEHPETVERARRYIAKIESIAGQRGHSSCFRACCKLVDYGLTYGEAWDLLVEWNETNAKPKWSSKELSHKLENAFNRK